MTEGAKSQSLMSVRLVTWLFPPAGMVLLWRRPLGIWRKLFGTLGIVLYCVPYLAFMLWFSWRFLGLKFEMRGTPVPIPTFWPTVPNFAKLEASRAQQGKAAAKAQGGGYWTDFRGPNRDGHYTDKPILTPWPAGGPKLLWRQPTCRRGPC